LSAKSSNEALYSANYSRRAPLWRQLATLCYDGLIVIGLLLTVTAAILIARGGNSFDPQSLWFRLALVATVWAYFSWSWTHGGQTVGMLAWRLRLTAADGTPAGLGAASLRLLGACLSAALFGLGYLWCLIDPAGRTWHDRISGTRLVYLPLRLAQAQDRDHRHDEQNSARGPGRDHRVEGEDVADLGRQPNDDVVAEPDDEPDEHAGSGARGA